MAFTVQDFPNLVFENMSHYKKYLDARRKIRARLLNETPNKTKVVKIANTVKHNDPMLEYIKKCISQYIITWLSEAQQKNKSA